MTKIPDDFFEPIELEKEKKDWTEKDWADYWKREQDIINDNFQKHKKKVDAQPKDKIIIRLDPRYFHKDTRLVIAFLKTVIKILNFASPLLAKFFPVAAPILWITRGISALELLLKLKLVTRLKMELKALNKDFADVVIFACELLNGVEKSYADKKLELTDLGNFMPALQAIGPAIAGVSDIEYPNGEALDECVELIKVRLDLADDALEAKAEKVIALAVALYKAVK